MEYLVHALIGLVASALASPLMSVLKAFIDRRATYKVRVGDVEIELRADNVKRIEEQVETMRRKPRVAILHAMEHAEFARRLARDLREHEIRVWLPEEKLRPGDQIAEVVDSAIDRVQWVIVVLPPRGRQAGWLQTEIRMVLAAEIERHRPLLIPVRLADSEMPQDLADRLYADFSANYERGLTSLLGGVQRALPRPGPDAG